MRILLAALMLAGTLSYAQTPVIGIIDFYGLRKIQESSIRRVLGVKEGDKLPSSKGEVEDKLENMPGIVRASLSASCCEAGRAILYVGIEEKGAPHFEIRTDPTGDIRLPEEIHAAYARFLDAVSSAVRKGTAAEDLTQGHSLMADADAREAQQGFLKIAEENLELLRKVIRESADEEHRAIAAYIIGYAPTKRLVTNDLQFAMQDADPTVRSNAMRALGAILVLAAKDPALEIKVTPTWFIEMLNSIYWEDRHNSAVALVNFTESRDERVLTHLREKGISSLTDMVKWKHLPHALPAFILLGRVAGLPEPEIQEMWKEGKRDELLVKLRKK
jgi:hypothetical protein